MEPGQPRPGPAGCVATVTRNTQTSADFPAWRIGALRASLQSRRDISLCPRALGPGCHCPRMAGARVLNKPPSVWVVFGAVLPLCKPWGRDGATGPSPQHSRGCGVPDTPTMPGSWALVLKRTAASQKLWPGHWCARGRECPFLPKQTHMSTSFSATSSPLGRPKVSLQGRREFPGPRPGLMAPVKLAKEGMREPQHPALGERSTQASVGGSVWNWEG